ncbi:leucine-rich repeat domain-containing protein [bacterium 210702-DFI.5.13]|uniref:leucine-rich repeat domain-containing protein n=1 Tax=Ruminococcus sp. RTP21484sp1_RTP31023st1_H8_RTP31023_210422 TaxID=3141611 RepID=UPI0034A187BC|nr:leucine-rich repeat domain-containing protein [bacterium 210702-DFI.5.13]
MQKGNVVNAVVNAVIDSNVLTVDTFNDLAKYCNNTVISVKSKTGIYGKIHKLVVKNSKCSMTIDNIKHLLKNYKIFDGLKEIEIITEDERFCTVDGMLYSKNKRRLYSCPRGKDGTLVIPDGTDTITEDSCSSCNFSKIIIPDSVKRIYEYAFIRNYALEEVDGCKNVERIGDFSFAYCQQLKKFPFGEFIKNIGDGAFSNTMLTEIYLPEGLSHVGRQAFNTICVVNGFQTYVGQSRMYDIHIPSTLKYIDAFAFANAANIYTPFVNAALIQAGTRSGNLKHCHECNIWKLKVDGKPDVIVPKSIDSTSYASKIANKINTVFGLTKKGKFITDNSVSKVVIPPELYQYSQDSTGLTAALEQCRKYPGSSLKQFITKNISTIFYNLITSPTSSNGEEIMVSLIKDGVFTETALKKLLKEIEGSACKENLITLKAYILDTIKPKNNTFKV